MYVIAAAARSFGGGPYLSDRQLHSLLSAGSSYLSDGALPGGKETLPFYGVESGFPAITEPPLDHEPLNRAARSGENLIEANHKVCDESSIHSCELVGLLPTEGLTSMTKMLSAPHGMPDAVAAVESVTEEVTQTPVLIAEQAVVFSTAAALRVRPAKTSRGLIAVLRGIFVDSTASAERPRRHYPPRRDSFLEHAAMAREMHRL